MLFHTLRVQACYSATSKAPVVHMNMQDFSMRTCRECSCCMRVMKLKRGDVLHLCPLECRQGDATRISLWPLMATCSRRAICWSLMFTRKYLVCRRIWYIVRFHDKLLRGWRSVGCAWIEWALVVILSSWFCHSAFVICVLV